MIQDSPRNEAARAAPLTSMERLQAWWAMVKKEPFKHLGGPVAISLIIGVLANFTYARLVAKEVPLELEMAYVNLNGSPPIELAVGTSVFLREDSTGSPVANLMLKAQEAQGTPRLLMFPHWYARRAGAREPLVHSFDPAGRFLYGVRDMSALTLLLVDYTGDLQGAALDAYLRQRFKIEDFEPRVDFDGWTVWCDRGCLVRKRDGSVIGRGELNPAAGAPSPDLLKVSWEEALQKRLERAEDLRFLGFTVPVELQP